jgi:nucleotide-binding universal stress UspA family protein
MLRFELPTNEKMIVEGNPSSEILRIAGENNADVIVMGSIGKTGLEKFLMGSVAERVVRSSKLPVLIVR